MKKFVIVAIALLPFRAICQESSDDHLTGRYSLDSIASFRSPKGYIPSLLYDMKVQTLSPLHFTKKNLLITGAAIGITGYLISIDGDIDEWARHLKSKHSEVNYISPKITTLGSNAGIYAIGGFGLISSVFHNPKGVQTSLLATQAMITSGIWVHMLKTLTLRERPDQSYTSSKMEGGRWYGPQLLYDRDINHVHSLSSLNAFASGHTATAFSIATVIAKQYSDRKLIPILAYGTASLAGLSRMTEHKHWASDVFAGAVLGYVCGNQVVSHFSKTHTLASQALSSRKPAPQFSFFENGAEIGIKLNWY